VILSKGIEEDTGDLPAEIVTQELGGACLTAILAGPTFARDVAQGFGTGFVCASTDPLVAQQVTTLVASPLTELFPSDDPRGIALSIALKNIIALGAGILRGAGYPDSTVALFSYKGLGEVEGLVALLGGQKTAPYTLAGLGDMIMTAWGTQSKNLEFGRLLGSGLSRSQAEKYLNRCVEGIFTLKGLFKLLDPLHCPAINFPLIQAIYKVVWNDEEGGLVYTALMQKKI
jgi:glycerol-3-phosphate dehydrogenase (NAD(P)+)